MNREPTANQLMWWTLAALLALASAGGTAWVRSLEGQVADTKTQQRAQESELRSQDGRIGDVRERMMRVETKVENVQKSVDDQKTDLGEIKGMLRSVPAQPERR